MGVSVASGANAVITAFASTSKAETIAATNAADNTVGDSKGGLVFEVTTADQSLTLGGTLDIAAIDGGATHNAYSILIDSATTENLSITATSAQSILVKALPTTTKDGGKAYVFANNSAKTVTFDKVNLVANASAISNKGTFGIYSGIDGAKYDFGSDTATSAKTVFASITNSAEATQNTAGEKATAIFIANNASFGGKLEFAAFAGQAGNAYGITADATGKTLSLDNATITFAGITGGKGEKSKGSANTDLAGNGGDAAGIYLDGTDNHSLTISGNGSLIFTSIAGGAAGDINTDGGAGQVGTAYVINNAGTGKLTLFNGAKIIAGSSTGAPTATYGIYSNLAGANYVFGKTTGSTEVNGVSQGMILNANATLSGKLSVVNTPDVGTTEDSNVGQENATGLVITGSTEAGHNLKTLDLSVSSTNGNVTAVALQGSSNDTAKNIKIDGITLNANSLTANNAEANKAIALSNTGKTNFTGVVALADDAF